jgi:hypothetical protein
LKELGAGDGTGGGLVCHGARSTMDRRLLEPRWLGGVTRLPPGPPIPNMWRWNLGAAF